MCKDIPPKRYRIAVAGMGYVGLSVAILLAQHHHVIAIDLLSEKIRQINCRQSPIRDPDMERYLSGHTLDLTATLHPEEAYRDADFVVVATPTDYDSRTGSFDTTALESVIRQVINIQPNAVIVIKSTVPVGYTDTLRKETGYPNILFSPEFLRESKALYDNLYPSRIVVGTQLQNRKLLSAAQTFAALLGQGAHKKQIDTFVMESAEAEAVKLFSNTYLALRVGFFNELDSFAEKKGLRTRPIIDAVCRDPRIGTHYNNPSFGYGGYCLPKDTKQLLANYGGIPQRLMEAIVESNRIRKDFIAGQILEMASHQPKNGQIPPVIGIYRLNMKSGSDNFRQSAVQGVMRRLMLQGARLVVYEPGLPEGENESGWTVTHDLEQFKALAQVIVANRWDASLSDAAAKVYTRDLFQRD